MTRNMTTALLCLIAAQGVVQADAQEQSPRTPEQRFLEWTELPFRPVELRRRRQAVMAQMQQSGGGVLLVPSADGLTSGGTFRQEDDFLYLTGLELPRSMLVLDADASRTVLFAPRRDERFEGPTRPNDFPGRPLADDASIAREAEIDDLRPFGEFDIFIARAMANRRTIRINRGQAGAIPRTGTGAIQTWSASATLALHLRERDSTARIENAFPQLARVRMVKSDAEIAVMRRAAGLSSQAIMTAARHVGPGMDERGLEAEFEAACKRGGSQRLAFASIIKSGPNSLWPWRILAAHYDRRNRGMQDGELVIFDVGCELDYYASDVGRTFPVSGEFSEEQRDILLMATAVSDAIIAAVAPGVTFRDLQVVAETAVPTEHRPYMQTGLFFGHHVGLAVGDPSLPDAILEPGMVFTVEPWYYNHDRDIAVFIEDQVLVTPDGAEMLSTLPRSPEDLENLVGGGR